MKLIFPNEKYLKSYNEARQEYIDNNVTTYDFMDSTKKDLFKTIYNFRHNIDLPTNYVPSTYLWLVEDDLFIGEINIRHYLNELLNRYGGHIGYGIRYSLWNKGYGTFMLKEALLYSKESLGLNKVLITCNDDNSGSSKVIEKNGGILQDKIVNHIEGVDKLSRRYWITIKD